MGVYRHVLSTMQDCPSVHIRLAAPALRERGYGTHNHRLGTTSLAC